MNTNNIDNLIPEIFASILAITAGVLIYISRLGFDNYGILIIKSIFISFFVIYTPCIVNRYMKTKIIKELYISKAFILLLCIILLVLMGIINNIVNIDISYLFVFIGGITIFSVLIDKYKIKYNQISIWMYMLFILIGIWAVAAYSLEGYYHPLFIEKIVTGAWSHRDTVWFASMAGMYKTYGVSSNGLDGLVPVYYHNFSHFIFGELSNLLKISTFTFYNIIIPILVTPVFFLSFIFCTKEASKYFSKNLNYKIVDESNIKFWIVFLVMFILPFPLQVIGSGERYQYITSGSYTVALLLTFIFVSIIFSYLNYSNNKDEVKPSNKIFLIIIAILLYFAISASKVSFLCVLGAIYGYLYLRFKYYNNVYHNITMAGFIGVTAIIFFMIINTETFLKNDFQRNSSNVSVSEYVLYIIPSLLYILLEVYSLKIRSLREIYAKIENLEILDIEILVLMIFILFPLSFQYFKGIQIYFAYILILSQLGHYNSLYLKTNDIIMNR